MANNRRRNNKKRNNNQQQSSNKTTAKMLKAGDEIRYGMPIKVSSMVPDKETLHDPINRGQNVFILRGVATAGPMAGKELTMRVTESDRVEYARGKPNSRWARIKQWIASWFTRREEDEGDDE